MRRDWELEDLIECWTLDEDELKLLANKSGPTRLGFALLLKFFEQEARFPRREDVPKPAIDFMAGQIKVDAALFGEYKWTGRTIEYHRAQVRTFYGFREPTLGDEDKLADWLAGEICPVELSRDHLRSALLTRCREVRSSRPGQRGLSGSWALPRRCSSGGSLPAPPSGCRPRHRSGCASSLSRVTRRAMPAAAAASCRN